MKAGGDTSSDLLNLQVVNADGQMGDFCEKMPITNPDKTNPTEPI